MEGSARSIGVSNYMVQHLEEVLEHCKVVPAVDQIELHPYLTQQRMLRFCNEQKVATTAFSPLGADSYLSLGMAEENERVLADPTITSIADHRLSNISPFYIR